MQGLLADVNLNHEPPILRGLLDDLGLRPLLVEANPRFLTLADLGLSPALSDRALWNYCQDEVWVLLTDNRNQNDKDSLEATLSDSWRVGHLPVLTLADKGRFNRDAECRARVASDIAELLFGIADGEYRVISTLVNPFDSTVELGGA